jgi:dTMP kinase
MLVRGHFIALEGIDGSGKRTQMDLLVRALAARGCECLPVSFPHYRGFFGTMVTRYLRGEFGTLEQVDPHFSALLYASDRLESKPFIEAALTRGRLVIADRYIASNLAHQGARVPAPQRSEFLDWLRKLEYQVYGLPSEDLVIYLRVPPVLAQRLAGERAASDSTRIQQDLQESNLRHLEEAFRLYDSLAAQDHWAVIEGAVRNQGDFPAELRSPGDIHSEVLAAVESRILQNLPAVET